MMESVSFVLKTIGDFHEITGLEKAGNITIVFTDFNTRKNDNGKTDVVFYRGVMTTGRIEMDPDAAEVLASKIREKIGA